MSFDSIVVATDFEETARAALDWAILLAQSLQARVLVAHVYDLPLAGLPDAALMVSAKTAARMSNEAQSALDAEVARVRDHGVPVEGMLRQGDPREVIPLIAASAQAALIVVGSQGRRGLLRGLLG
ncbi:MAG: universal stress protein, partial [Myxococcota bacterium]|nr:universal stress protein [Myxococcota bacterium]